VRYYPPVSASAVPPPSVASPIFSARLPEKPLRSTCPWSWPGAGGDNGVDRNTTWLRFTNYDSTFFPGPMISARTRTRTLNAGPGHGRSGRPRTR
jgi:hypothetical protein